MINWKKRPDMVEFMLAFMPGHEEKEIKQAFLDRFGILLTEGQISGFKYSHNIWSGTHGGRFVKGQESHNKGNKLTPEQYEKVKATMFKKGNVPANVRPVGSERVDVDGYIKIKIAEPDVWQHKQRYIWEQANGPVPKGYAIIFEDGDRRNFDLDNLKCIPKSLLSYINIKKLHGKADVETFELMKQLDEAIRGKEKKSDVQQDGKKEFEDDD